MSTSREETETQRWVDMHDLALRQAKALERIAARIEEVDDREKAERERRANRVRPSIHASINKLFQEAMTAAETRDWQSPTMACVHPQLHVAGGTEHATVGGFVFAALMNLSLRVAAVLDGKPLSET